MLELNHLYLKFQYQVEWNSNVVVHHDQMQLISMNKIFYVDDQVMNVQLNKEYQMKKNQHQNLLN
jgi:hypothetical protein